MKGKRSLGILLCVIGIALVFFSMYISGETAQGRRRISSAQRQVDTGKRLFSVTPFTKEVGRGLTGSAQRRIDEGKREVAEYENMAYWFKIGGAVLVVIGIGVLWTSRKRR